MYNTEGNAFILKNSLEHHDTDLLGGFKHFMDNGYTDVNGIGPLNYRLENTRDAYETSYFADLCRHQISGGIDPADKILNSYAVRAFLELYLRFHKRMSSYKNVKTFAEIPSDYKCIRIHENNRKTLYIKCIKEESRNKVRLTFETYGNKIRIWNLFNEYYHRFEDEDCKMLAIYLIAFMDHIITLNLKMDSGIMRFVNEYVSGEY